MSKRFLRGGLYVLVFCLPFAKAVIEIAFGVMFVAWLCLVWTRLQRREQWWPLPAAITWPLAVYTVICAISVLTSSQPSISLSGLIGKTLEYLLFLIIIAEIGQDHAVVRRAAGIFCVSAALIGVDAWLQEWTGTDWLLGHTLIHAGYGRMTGPYDDPNDLATYFMVMLLIILVVWRQASGRRRVWLSSLLLLLFLSFVRTDSQGAWLGIIMGTAVLLWRARGLWRPILVAMALLVIGGVVRVWWHGLPSYAEAIGSGPTDRLFIWRAALGMVRDHPWTGVGLNAFMANYLNYWVGGERMPRYAHNCYLQTAAEIGIPGLVAFLWLLGALVTSWWRRLAGTTPEWARITLAGLLAAALAFLVQSAVDTNFYSLRQVTLFWVVAGLATGLSLSGPRSDEPAPAASLVAAGAS